MNIIQKILFKFKIITTDTCSGCGQEKTEHGWYGYKDCMNEKCKNYRYLYKNPKWGE